MEQNKIGTDVLIYDIETKTFGKPDATKDELRLFGCYSYKTNKYYMLTKKEDIQNIIKAHKFVVGFNNKAYDNPIIERFGVKFEYKIIIDLREIFKKRASQMKIKEGMLGDLIMSYSLDFITRLLHLVDDSQAKLKIDYNIFKKALWTPEERKEIDEYTRRDIEVTKKLYEFVEDYFESFKPFISKDDVKKKVHLTCTIAKFAYKAICKAMNWHETYGTGGDDFSERISGGYVAYPAGEKFEGDIYCLDFNCFPTGTKIRMCTKHGVNSHYYDKNIENIKPGDKIFNQDGQQIVGAVNKEWYEGELISFELENGRKVRCTPDHKFPIYRNGKELVVEACNIKETDDMITTYTKRGKNNPGFKQGQIPKICCVCGTEYFIYPSQDFITTCCTECANVQRSINCSKSNLGKTKYDTPHLMKMSLNRKGKKRSKEIKKNISIATKAAMKNVDMSTINKNRDMSFMNTIEWRLKVAQSKMCNVKEGKFRYNNINFRSNWEVILAKNMDKNNIKWKYEPRVFKLDEKIFYLPDFYLPDYDKYVEVKGFMYDHSREKIQKFMEHHELILLNDLNKIKDEGVQWLKSEA